MSRRTGWWGIAFVVCVLVAAAGVSLPPSTWEPARLAAFYHQNGNAVVVTQLVGLLALGPLVMLLRGILRGGLRQTRFGATAVAGTGAAVGVANVLTVAPVLVLALLNTAAPDTWTRLTRLSELSDDVLFGAIALFAGALAYAGARTWLRILAAVVAALSLGRCVAGPLGSTAFDVIAPTAFLVLILAISGSILTSRQPTTSP